MRAGPLLLVILILLPAGAETAGNGQNRGLSPSRAVDYWEAAQRHFACGEFAAAIDCLQRFRPANGDVKGEAAYLHLRGASRLMLGQVNPARNDLERAIQLDASQSGYYLDLALACIKVGDRRRADTIAALARQRFPNDIKLRVQMASLFEPAWRPSAWRLEGEGIIACPCQTPCPCRSNAPPTGSRCEALGVMRIVSGYWEKTSLHDRRFAIPGCMSNPFRFVPVLYIDSNFSDAEQQALTQILREFNDQHSMLFVTTRRVPISFRKQGDLLEAGSPGLFGVKVELGANTKSVAALDYFANTIRYAKNLLYWFRDPLLSPSANWDFSGRQANYRIISVGADDYRQNRMLIQFADESGGFNARQWELIRKLHLPVATSLSGVP